MRTKLTVVCAITALAAITGGTVQAAGLIDTNGIAKGAVTFNRLAPSVQTMLASKGHHGKSGKHGVKGEHGANGVEGAHGSNGATGPQGAAGEMGPQGPAGVKGDIGPKGASGANGTDGTNGLKGDVGPAGPIGPQGTKGFDGVNGTNGTNGTNGLKGDTGPAGPAGPAGPMGPQGPKGDTGAKGADGAQGDVGPKGDAGTDGLNAPLAQYGIATVNVSRGHDVNGQKPATTWATYSTLLGSPVGDNTGGTFPFTCSTANAPCTVAVKAAALGSGSVRVYPRVLIMRQDYDSGDPSVYCEYGDGSTGAGVATIAKQASSSTPTYSAMQINIGGSADCAGPTPRRAT